LVRRTASQPAAAQQAGGDDEERTQGGADDLHRMRRSLVLLHLPPTHRVLSPILENGGSEDDLQQPLDPIRLGLIPSYIEEDRHIACQLIRKCHDDGRHFMLLATEDPEGRLSAVLDALVILGASANFGTSCPFRAAVAE
jgi:hypothetical protein